MNLSQLEARRAEIAVDARAIHRGITEEIPETEAQQLGRQFDALMLEHDDLSDQIARAKVGERPDPRRPIGEASEARGDALLPTEIDAYSIRPEQRMSDWARREGNADPRDSLSPGKFLRAMVLGAKTEAEQRALAEGTDAAGGFTVPVITSSQMIDLVRANSVLTQAGATTVPLTTDEVIIAKLATDPVPGWRTENASVAESEPTFARVRLIPRSLAVLVRASVELMEDSLNLEAELPRIMARALAVEVDRVGVVGSGTAPEPLGIVNYAGLTVNGFGGGALISYAPLIDARTALHNVNERLSGFVMSPRDEGTFASLTATDGQPLRKPEAIAETQMLWTSNMPTDGGAGTESEIIGGDWSQLIMGVRSSIRIVPLRERYMTELQFGFIAHIRVDFAATREAAFTVLSGITP